MTRSGAAIFTAGMVAVVLTGCSVPMSGYMGLTVVDDRVISVITMCDGATAHQIDMIPQAGQFFLIPHPVWDFESAEAPEVDLGSTEDFLKKVGDVHMRLDVQTDQMGAVWSPNFFAADIEALKPDEILIQLESHELYSASRTEYIERADEFCSDLLIPSKN